MAPNTGANVTEKKTGCGGTCCAVSIRLEQGSDYRGALPACMSRTHVLVFSLINDKVMMRNRRVAELQ